MEGKKQSEDEEDEDEQFLVEEAALLLPEMPDLEVVRVQGEPLEERWSITNDVHLNWKH